MSMTKWLAALGLLSLERLSRRRPNALLYHGSTQDRKKAVLLEGLGGSGARSTYSWEFPDLRVLVPYGGVYFSPDRSEAVRYAKTEAYERGYAPALATVEGDLLEEGWALDEDEFCEAFAQEHLVPLGPSIFEDPNNFQAFANLLQHGAQYDADALREEFEMNWPWIGEAEFRRLVEANNAFQLHSVACHILDAHPDPSRKRFLHDARTEAVLRRAVRQTYYAKRKVLDPLTRDPAFLRWGVEKGQRLRWLGRPITKDSRPRLVSWGEP